jgi:hypothetical protein
MTPEPWPLLCCGGKEIATPYSNRAVFVEEFRRVSHASNG